MLAQLPNNIITNISTDISAMLRFMRQAPLCEIPLSLPLRLPLFLFLIFIFIVFISAVDHILDGALVLCHLGRICTLLRLSLAA